MRKQLSRSIPLPVRFGLNVERHESGCWIWVGAKTGNGYGHICSSGRKDMAHRVSWMIHRGPIPEGMEVCHSCDVRPCVNPAHLFLGTQSDNMQDCAKKGRLADVSGENSPTAKLSNLQASEIRNSCEPVKVLAAQYGISIWTVYDIRSGRSRQPRTQIAKEGQCTANGSY